jgi:hypothetical protein
VTNGDIKSLFNQSLGFLTVIRVAASDDKFSMVEHPRNCAHSRTTDTYKEESVARVESVSQ